MLSLHLHLPLRHIPIKQGFCIHSMYYIVPVFTGEHHKQPREPCCFGQSPDDSGMCRSQSGLEEWRPRTTLPTTASASSHRLWEKARTLPVKIQSMPCSFLSTVHTVETKADIFFFTLGTFLATLGQDPWFSLLFSKAEKGDLGFVGHH